MFTEQEIYRLKNEKLSLVELKEITAKMSLWVKVFVKDFEYLNVQIKSIRNS